MTDRGATKLDGLETAYELGKAKGLKYVYIGNMPGANKQQTECPACGETLMGRAGFSAGRTAVKDGKCAHCGEPIHGVDLG